MLTPPELGLVSPWVRALAVAVGLALPACDGSSAKVDDPDAAATPDAKLPAADAMPPGGAVPDAVMGADAVTVAVPDAAPLARDAVQAVADAAPPPPPVTLSAVDPPIVDPLGGSRVVVTGAGFAESADHAGVTEVHLGGVAVRSFHVVSDTELALVSPPLESAAAIDLEVVRGDERSVLAGALEAWSPAELPGARLFDAAAGVEAAEPTTSYEWQRLTGDMGGARSWLVRDGNTLTWLPATGRFWMVAGWNPYEVPEGFGTPPTTDEVWSSPDGITWTPELPHGHGAFEIRHSHNTVHWRDRLWMIGGDTHQGFYNHDVVSSADGVHWTVELGPGTTEPPWSERGLQVSGVYDGKLWTVGGQDLFGPVEDYTYHNDVWSTEDGRHWTQVAPDAPGSDTRWAGCGVLDGLVEFRGEMWLVGCARERENAEGHSMSNEVWSTRDGVTWRQHTTPPWVGKIWPNVVVWDDRLWILFGYTYGDSAHGFGAGNANEAWYSDDGETWQSLPPDMPVPGSHAQGVAVTDEFLLLAGGNYGFGFGAGLDKSTWRLMPFRGEAVRAWRDRGPEHLTVAAPDENARPVRVADAFGAGAPGLQFDGSRSVLVLPEAGVDLQAEGRSVFWVARAPYLPNPWGWEETYTPVGTIVGGPGEGGGMPVSSVGLSGGQIVVLNLEPTLGPAGEPVWSRLAAGTGLQEGPGEVHLAGVTHAPDGRLQAWVDGVPEGPVAMTAYDTPRSWSQLGGGMDGPYYGPNSRFAGTLGAVVVLPSVADETAVARIHAWARGRFGAR